MYAKVAANRQPLRMGDMTEEELLAYNGSNPKIPLLIAIKRQIYDVSSFREPDRRRLHLVRTKLRQPDKLSGRVLHAALADAC
nr:membrane steroid-binding protein 2 [Ipomoea batatas]